MAYSFRICAYYLKSVFKSSQSKRNRQVKIFPNYNLSTPELSLTPNVVFSFNIAASRSFPSFGNTESSLNFVLHACFWKICANNQYSWHDLPSGLKNLHYHERGSITKIALLSFRLILFLKLLASAVRYNPKLPRTKQRGSHRPLWLWWWALFRIILAESWKQEDTY